MPCAVVTIRFTSRAGTTAHGLTGPVSPLRTGGRSLGHGLTSSRRRFTALLPTTVAKVASSRLTVPEVGLIIGSQGIGRVTAVSSEVARRTVDGLTTSTRIVTTRGALLSMLIATTSIRKRRYKRFLFLGFTQNAK